MPLTSGEEIDEDHGQNDQPTKGIQQIKRAKIAGRLDDGAPAVRAWFVRSWFAPRTCRVERTEPGRAVGHAGRRRQVEERTRWRGATGHLFAGHDVLRNHS